MVITFDIQTLEIQVQLPPLKMSYSYVPLSLASLISSQYNISLTTISIHEGAAFST